MTRGAQPAANVAAGTGVNVFPKVNGNKTANAAHPSSTAYVNAQAARPEQKAGVTVRLAQSEERSPERKKVCRKGAALISFFSLASSLLAGLCFAASATAQDVVGSDPLLKVVPIAPERVAPLKERLLPAVSPVEGKATYLQYSDLGDHDRCAPILVTRLPNPHKRLPSGPVPTWQLSLLAYYDADRKAVQPPEGRNLHGCPGGCPGSMTLMIHNSFSAPFRLPQAVFRRVKSDQQWAVVRQGDCLFAESEFGFKYKVSTYFGVTCDNPEKRYQKRPDGLPAKEYYDRVPRIGVTALSPFDLRQAWPV